MSWLGIWDESVVLWYASVAGDNGVDVILEDGGWDSVQELEEESLVLLSSSNYLSYDYNTIIFFVEQDVWSVVLCWWMFYL